MSAKRRRHPEAARRERGRGPMRVRQAMAAAFQAAVVASDILVRALGYRKRSWRRERHPATCIGVTKLRRAP